MSISQISIYIAVYILPILFMFGLACIVITQQAKRLENRLIATILFTYCIIFMGELFRHLLPISYSSFLVKIMLGSFGVLIIGLSLHLYIYVADLQRYLRKRIYPFLFYIPFISVVIVKFLGLNYFSSTTYNLEGIWYKSEVNDIYYFFLTSVVLVNIILLFILVLGNRKLIDRKRKKLLRFWMLYSLVTLVTKISFGYLSYGDIFPPYPIIYEGLLFAVFISVSYLHNDLLPIITKRYQTLFDISPVSIMIINGNMDIIEINKEGKKLLEIEDSLDLNLLEFVQSTHNKNQLNKFLEDIQRDGIVQDYPVTLTNISKEGIFYLSIDAKMVVTGEEKSYYVMLRDVTSEVKNEKLILHMAYHDVLTDLHNRAYFVMQLNIKLMDLSKDETSFSAFVLLDLNDFKSINDSFGHHIGDQVLQHTASILKKSVSESDLVARLGGDEFVLFLQQYNSKEEIDQCIDDLRSSFKLQTFLYNDEKIKIEPSIGISIYPEQGITVEDLFTQADLNMYADKEIIKSKKLGV